MITVIANLKGGTGKSTVTFNLAIWLQSMGRRVTAIDLDPQQTLADAAALAEGRFASDEGRIMPGLYCVGWARRGPTGTIGTNKPDANETVELMIADLPNTPAAAEPNPQAVVELLQQRNIRYITLEEWQHLDSMETEAGEQQGRPRVKITSVDEMLDALQK